MNTKAFFLCWEGSNLNLGTGKENQIFILRTPATVKFFFTGLSKNDFGIILQTLTHPLIHVIDCKLCKLVMGIPPVMPL